MGVEIERKFLVNKEKWSKINKPKSLTIKQGYLHNSIEKCVRIRTKEEKGFLTIKGENSGIKRTEFEYEIPYSEAEEMLNQFCDKFIHKKRYEIQFNDKIWEVDEFLSPNPDLILAEIELKSENQAFDLPEWVEQEVSDDPKYYNANMLK